MIEKNSPPILEREKISRDIFTIYPNTDSIISCIQGIYSSQKLTNALISRGSENFSCLSGGVSGLADFFHDTETINNIDFYFPYAFDNSRQKTIFEETKETQQNYYRKLKNKTLYIITHGTFTDLNETITGKILQQKGVKEIICFRGESGFKDFILNKFNIKI